MESEKESVGIAAPGRSKFGINPTDRGPIVMAERIEK